MRPDENKKRHIVVCGKGGGGQAESVEWDDILNKPNFATVATTGDYDDLTDKPTIPAAPVQSDWNEADSTSLAYIANKPTIPPQQWFGTQAEYDLIDPKDPNTIYNIEGSDNVQADWNQSDSTADDYIKNKPTIPAAPVQSDWNESDNTSLAYIANKPSIPAAQVNADWNANSGVAQILNKPTIPTVPAMTTETLTFTLQGGTIKTVEFYTVPNYFYVEDISGSDNTLSITKQSNNPQSVEVFKSTDKINWTSMGTTSTTPITTTIPANGKLYLKATTERWGASGYGNVITATGNHNVGGNIMSLLYGDNFNDKTTFPNSLLVGTNGFNNLFWENTKLINANNLLLPATTLIKGCYNGMFWGCTNLLTSPTILPATYIVDSAYSNMFKLCSSLTTTPVIMATTTASWGANRMFDSCTSISSITCYLTDVSPQGCIMNWLIDAATTGDFYNLGGATYTSDANGIPSGWTEHTSL